MVFGCIVVSPSFDADNSYFKMGLGDLPANVAEYLARCRAEADKDPLMKAEIDKEEAKSAAISAARNAANIRKGQAEENKKAGAHRTHEEKLKENEDNQKMLLKQTKKNELLIKRAMDPQSLVAENDRLTQQVLEGQEREKRYRSERNAAKAENVKLKKSNDDKDRKIAALECQLAAASTS